MKKVISAFYIHGTGIVSEYVHMYKCVHVFINTRLNACFKHRLLGQNHDSESVEFRSSSLTTRHRLSKLISALAVRSVGFISFVLINTAKVLNLYLGLFYTTFHERLGNIVGTSLDELPSASSVTTRLNQCKHCFFSRCSVRSWFPD